jgi:hypothetical protein
MIASEGLEVLEHFCKNPWEFQRTFATPLENLQSFVDTIVSAAGPLQSGALTIEQVVFDPKDLAGMLANYSILPRFRRGFCLTAAGTQEVNELVRVVLGEWIDFLFIPEPKSFAIYTDHDEYTTFYAHTRTNLDRIVRALSDQGFKAIPNYERLFR